MARKNTQLGASVSEACRGWVKQYGFHHRHLLMCARTIQRARSSGRKMQAAVHMCAPILKDAQSDVHGVGFVADCVGSGYSHGVVQPRRRKRGRR